MSRVEEYKTFRVNIEAETLLDDFAPVLIDDISQKFEAIFEIKEDYCLEMKRHRESFRAFPELSRLSDILTERISQLNSDFEDCKDNTNYFTLVFMGAVSAGKTSTICDLLNLNPDQLNRSLNSSNSNFETGLDDVVIAGEVATTNVYEFLVESSRIRLVDIPGTGGVVHDNSTIAPFINKADCVIFLSNAQSDLTRDDYDFVVRHIVGLNNVGDLTSETVSSKKALIVVNKWNSVIRNLPPGRHEKEWRRKEEWILWGDSKKERRGKFNGLSGLFKYALTIVPATTSQRILSDDGSYERYGESDANLSEVTSSLEKILTEEGIEIKLERPRIILRNSLSDAKELLANERTKCAVDELVEKLESAGVRVSINSTSIMENLNTRLENLQYRLKQDLYSQIRRGLDQWTPSVSLMDRVKGVWPKEWWGSEKFGAKVVQEDLRARWKDEIEDLMRESIDPSHIERTISNEANAISQSLELTFQAQLADLPKQISQSGLSGKISFDSSDSGLNKIESSRALEDAIESAVSQIKYSIVDDVIGIVTVDAIVATLLGVFLSPVGSAAFFAARRWMSGQSEKKKAKRELEDQIWNIAEEASSDLQEKVADKLRNSVQESVNGLTQIIQGERDSLSNLIQAIDSAIETVANMRERVEVVASSPKQLPEKVV
ncbi:MAG: hypothetical protein AAFN38_24135 [Cyanobacteria bacterium J06560_5]